MANSKTKSKPSAHENKQIAIMYRPNTPDAVSQAAALSEKLIKAGHSVIATPGQTLGKGSGKFSEAKLDDLDWVIVLGGDGTYLNAVRMLDGRKTPILGINMGSLGFLTPFQKGELQNAVDLLLKGKLESRPRSQLRICVKRAGKIVAQHVALNDAVLERGSSTHLINISVHSQGHLVATVKADALIIASPTGSTAYNLAAGGPILHPEVRAVVVTPVCPHALTSRPLIFPDDQELSFRALARDKPAVLIVDGANRGPITVDDEVVIIRDSADHYVVREKGHNYFSLLREKLRFGERA